MTAVVGVVNHNTAAELEACLAAVRATCSLPVVVVDNASSDDSVARVRRCDPDAVVLERANIGFGAGANEAIRWAAAQCSAEAVVVLNADARVQPGAVDRLVERVSGHGRVAVAGPRLVGRDGLPQRSAHPEPTVVGMFLQESGLHRLTGERVPEAPAWLLGAALAIRVPAWSDVGGFDEAYGMYFEEVDLCRRSRDNGWEIEFVDEAEVVHRGGASTDQVRWPLKRRYYTSAARYFRRHHGRTTFMALQVAMAAILVARIGRDGLRFLARRDAGAGDALRAWAVILADDVRGWPERPWP